MSLPSSVIGVALALLSAGCASRFRGQPETAALFTQRASAPVSSALLWKVPVCQSPADCGASAPDTQWRCVNHSCLAVTGGDQSTSVASAEDEPVAAEPVAAEPVAPVVADAQPLEGEEASAEPSTPGEPAASPPADPSPVKPALPLGASLPCEPGVLNPGC